MTVKMTVAQRRACIEASRGPNRVPQSKLAAQTGVSQKTISDRVKKYADFHACRTRYESDIKQRAIQLHSEGWTTMRIARELGTSHTSVRRWLS